MKREPRQFRALQDLSGIAEQRGDWKGAYAAWTRALELDPKTPGGADRLKDLKRRAFGIDVGKLLAAFAERSIREATIDHRRAGRLIGRFVR